jgi:serine/threonine-protein kinase
MLGRTLAEKYTIVARLGAGSMGIVYRARRTGTKPDVAIKVLLGHALDERTKVRFLREARASRLLTSPHTVPIVDFGQAHSGELFLAMELLEGESLGQRIRSLIRIPPEQALETCRQALHCLAEAHSKGIIHRDLKPDNLFYAKVSGNHRIGEMVKVLDFGIAKVSGHEPTNVGDTQAGTVFGTPRYMSPEQAQGKPLDGRSDLYSLGVILYQMITGRPPFTDEDGVVVMAHHIKSPAPSFAKAAPDLLVPADVEALTMRLLTKNPKGRPANAEALLEEIARISEGQRLIRERALVSSPSWRLAREDARRSRAAGASRFLETLELAGRSMGSSPWPALTLAALVASGAAVLGARKALRGSSERAVTRRAVVTSPAATDPSKGGWPQKKGLSPLSSARSFATTSPTLTDIIPTISVDALPKATETVTSQGHRRPVRSSAETAATSPSASSSVRATATR